MKYIKDPDFQLKNTAVALGKFEGLHRGHQLLFEEIKKKKAEGRKSVVFTFDMPPRFTLQGDTAYQQIYTKEERRILLEELQIDILVEYPFTRAFASQTPEEFVRDILVKKAGAKVIVVGEDFRFGRKRSGDITVLRELAPKYGYKLTVVKKLKIGDQDVSSTRIHEHLAKGEMEQAQELLGRPYTVIGQVVHGHALGRTIRIPTANLLADQNKLTPPNGVYVSRVYIDGEDEPFYGITNVGVKPTVEEHALKGIETNILDFGKTIYGKTIRVELLHFKRPEMQFTSVEKLRCQIESDIEFAVQYAQKNS